MTEEIYKLIDELYAKLGRANTLFINKYVKGGLIKNERTYCIIINIKSCHM